MSRFKDYKPRLILYLVAVFLFVFWNFPKIIKAEESSCVSCHTSGSKLIKITRKIESSKPKVEKSAESKGEG